MTFSSISNYYERLVYEQIYQQLPSQTGKDKDDDLLDDIACVALNQLPSRYVRHNVDMVYYMTPEERHSISEDVKRAVSNAIDYVNQHRRKQ